MAAQCYTSIQGLAMRLTRLNTCGVPVTGANASLIQDCFVKVELSPEIEDGTEYKLKSANGQYCVNDRSCPLLSWLNIAAEFCCVDPDAMELMGHRSLDDYAGTAVGFVVDEEVACRSNFALEIWTKISGAGACSAAGDRYIYWLFPWVVDAAFGDWTIEDGVATFTINARTKSGGGWGCGPYDVVWSAAETPGRLEAPGVQTKDHLLTRITEVAPPTPGCGYSETPVPATLVCA